MTRQECIAHLSQRSLSPTHRRAALWGAVPSNAGIQPLLPHLITHTPKSRIRLRPAKEKRRREDIWIWDSHSGSISLEYRPWKAQGKGLGLSQQTGHSNLNLMDLDMGSLAFAHAELYSLVGRVDDEYIQGFAALCERTATQNRRSPTDYTARMLHGAKSWLPLGGRPAFIIRMERKRGLKCDADSGHTQRRCSLF